MNGRRRTTSVRVLDLEGFSKHRRAQGRKAFEALFPRGSSEMIVYRKPGQLFFELHQSYGLNFYWRPLEWGPARRRAMIARPALGAQPTFASLTNADHQRVHQLWDECAAAVELCLRGLIQRRVAELSPVV